MRGVPAWHRRHSGQHPSTVLALRANPPPGASHGPRPPFGPHKGRRKKRRIAANHPPRYLRRPACLRRPSAGASHA
ncbi:MAG: hypothetical protein EOR84_10005 [Mesorhizobium sp.]|nr:MAG: hypothetical protein EOR84_10005 [Mesorhizobium sp.]